MAQKIVKVQGVGPVLFSKRRGTKNLRLTITPTGQIRVGMPSWTPYSVGIRFARSRQQWIAKHQALAGVIHLKDGDRIGKSHRLNFRPRNGKRLIISTRITRTEVIINTDLPLADPAVQKKAYTACERALKQQATVLLPKRLQELSVKNGLSYKSIRILKLTSRWGSCSSKGDISLSYFLVQLPWELIDYVILHELTHTTHLNHSPAFWSQLNQYMPSTTVNRKTIKTYQPRITPV